MGATDALGQIVLGGTTLGIETTFNPGAPINIDLTPTDGSGGPSAPNPILSFIKPRVTLSNSGATIIDEAPAGNPEDGPPWGLIAVGVGVSIAIVVSAWILAS